MAKKPAAETPPSERRQALADDVAAFLNAGNKIKRIPSGVSGQDPLGRGQPFRLGNPKK